jgi:hypothetical protein
MPFESAAQADRQHRDRLRSVAGLQRAHARARQGHRRRLAGVALAAAAQGALRRQLDRRDLSERSDQDRRSAAPIGTHVNTHVPGPRWADYVAMVDGALNAPLHPFYSESVKRMKMKQGLPFVEGAPVGHRRHLPLDQGRRRGAQARSGRGRTRSPPRSATRCVRAMADYPLNGLTFMVAGYEGHEFLLVRLLIEAGANVPYLSTAVNTNPLAREEEAWLKEHGCTVLYGANFDDEIGALDRSPLRLRDRHDAALRARQRARHSLDLLHQRHGDALADARRRRERRSLASSRRPCAASRATTIARFFADGEARAAPTRSWAPTIDLTAAPAGATTPLMARSARTSSVLQARTQVSDVVNTPIRKQVTDLDHAGGDTGAMQVFASLRDANVVLDGPVGCHVMPAVAVINYTDSIPYLQNVTCSELSENEVTIAGTLGVLKEKVARASRRPPSLHRLDARLGTDRRNVDDRARHEGLGAVLRLRTRSTTTSGSRATARCSSCGRTASTSCARRRAAPPKPARPVGQHHRPDLRQLQLLQRPRRDEAADRRHRRRRQPRLSVRGEFVRHAAARRCRRDDRDVPRVRRSLAREVGLPTFFAPIGLEPTTAFLARPRRGARLASRSRRVHPLEKTTTLAAWHDIWRSTHSDFFANAPIAIVAPPTYKDG